MRIIILSNMIVYEINQFLDILKLYLMLNFYYENIIEAAKLF